MGKSALPFVGMTGAYREGDVGSGHRGGGQLHWKSTSFFRSVDDIRVNLC